MTLKRYAVVVTLAFIIAALIACSRSSSPNPATPGTPPGSTVRKVNQLAFSWIPGLRTARTPVNTVTAEDRGFDWTITPKAYAQSAGATVVDSTGYTGACERLPVNSAPDRDSLIAGFVPLNFGCGEMAAATPVSWYANDGVPVIGNGAVKGLVVFGNSSGLHQAPLPTTTRISVFVNGQPTEISCSLAPVDSNSNRLRCQDATHSAAVKDNDSIEVTAHNEGNPVLNLRVFLGKEVTVQ